MYSLLGVGETWSCPKRKQDEGIERRIFLQAESSPLYYNIRIKPTIDQSTQHILDGEKQLHIQATEDSH